MLRKQTLEPLQKEQEHAATTPRRPIKRISNSQQFRVNSKFILSPVSSRKIIDDSSLRATYIGPDPFNSKTHLARSNIAISDTNEFYSTLKELSKIKQINSIMENKDNVYLKMLGSMEHNDLLPRKLNLIGTDSKEINLSGQMSMVYFPMFLEGLKDQAFEKLQYLDLSHNQFDEQAIQQLGEAIPLNLTHLNLASTGITKNYPLAKLLSSRIKVLNLKNNQLNNVDNIFGLLIPNHTLQSLNLSGNKLEDVSAIGAYLKTNQSMEQLYLQLNQITGRGGRLLFEGLHKNTTLKVLDISFNRLGRDIDCCTAICDLIQKQNNELLHVDLSRNQFTLEESVKIAKDLAFNRIIYGFHFEGNTKYVINSRGFLVSNSDIQQTNYSNRDLDEILVHSISGVDPIFHNLEKNILPLDICWICQGWVEVKFHYCPKQSGSIDCEPIFIHFDFEQFRPSLLLKEDEQFTIYKMCPPNVKVTYFFSNPLLEIMTYAKDQATTHTSGILQEKGIPLKYSDGTIMMCHPMQIINQCMTHQAPLFDKNYNVLVNCKPREPEKIIEISKQFTAKRIWTLENSFFNDYDKDTEAHARDCLEFDISQSKLCQHISPEEKAALIQQIQPYYQQIVQTYKYFCSLTLNYDFPRMGPMVILMFFQQVSDHIKQVDWDLSLISTMTVNRSYLYVNEKALVRHQFLEMLIRVARDIGVHIHESFQHALRFVTQTDCAQQWRDERYWIQIMDLTIQFKMPLLRALFNLTSQLTLKRSHTKERFVSLQDFKTFIFLADLQPSEISEEELYQIFLQSMMLQIDEVNYPRHFEMRFIEYVEALARLAEKISPNSPFYQEKQMVQAKRKILPLYIKFEGLLFILYHRMKQRMQNFTLEKAVVNKTVLSSCEVKKYGIQIEDSDDSSDSESEDIMKSSKKSIYNDNQKIINDLLYQQQESEHSTRQQERTISKRTSIIKLFKSQIDIVNPQQTTTTGDGWRKARTLVKRATLSYNPLNEFKRAQEDYELAEEQQFEQSSPMTKIKMANKRSLLRKHTINVNSQIEYLYDLDQIDTLKET